MGVIRPSCVFVLDECVYNIIIEPRKWKIAEDTHEKTIFIVNFLYF